MYLRADLGESSREKDSGQEIKNQQIQARGRCGRSECQRCGALAPWRFPVHAPCGGATPLGHRRRRRRVLMLGCELEVAATACRRAGGGGGGRTGDGGPVACRLVGD